VAGGLRLKRPADLRLGLVPDGGETLEQHRHLGGEQTAVFGPDLRTQSPARGGEQYGWDEVSDEVDWISFRATRPQCAWTGLFYIVMEHPRTTGACDGE
jgi:hypothetical protein